jgi:hypothetical protein
MAELGDVLTLDELTCPRKGEESTMSYVVGVGYDKANHRYYVLSSDILRFGLWIAWRKCCAHVRAEPSLLFAVKAMRPRLSLAL